MKRLLILTLLFSLILTSCSRGGAPEATPASAGLPEDAAALAAERGLTPNDIYAALKTYMPSGQLDPYILFASGGQSGQVLAIGVPSMRILKMIAVFTPEPWQGFGFGGSTNHTTRSRHVDGNELVMDDYTIQRFLKRAANTTAVLLNDQANTLEVIDCAILRPSKY
jgi:nitrous-oxide reductase